MPKSNEDRLQEAIEDALDGRAIVPMYDWRHPISAVSALRELIRLRQNEAFQKGVEEGMEYSADEDRGTTVERYEIVNPYEEET